MSELEEVLKQAEGAIIPISSFEEFIEKCSNGRNLVTIQIPRATREDEIFVAYFVKGLLKINHGYRPLSDSHIYNAIITKGTIEEKGDWVLPPMNYSVIITEEMFKQGNFCIKPQFTFGKLH